MLSGLTLSVLDQSPMRLGGTAADALHESVELARAAERLGYHRYWVAEHHNATSFAGTSPEVLIGLIAGQTRRIRVGSGGVMLSNYSALKVAEQFRVLQAFFDGRIDLGLGRARGGDPQAAQALSHPRPLISYEEFTRQVADLLGFLNGTTAPEHPFACVKAQPGPVPGASVDVWMLGSSDSTALTAGALGLPFAFAHFLSGDDEAAASAAEHYRGAFRPSGDLREPRLCLAVEVVCAPTAEEARFLALSRDFDAIASLYGVEGLLRPEEVGDYSPPAEAKAFMERMSRRCLAGDAEQIGERVLGLALKAGAGEVIVLTNCYSFENRVRSYELVADALGRA